MRKNNLLNNLLLLMRMARTVVMAALRQGSDWIACHVLDHHVERVVELGINGRWECVRCQRLGETVPFAFAFVPFSFAEPDADADATSEGGTSEEGTSEGHWYDDDVNWVGSGRDGDPWIKASWLPRKCYCDRPWRHG